jgi:hypothetical protein
MTAEFDFDDGLPFDAGERGGFLADAAVALDRLGMHYGPGQTQGTTTVGDFARAFAKDVAQVQKPQIYRLDAALLDRDRSDVPVGADELVREFRFYWLSLPMSLWARPGWGFNRLEAKAEFEAEGGATTFDLLPDQAFATRFSVNTSLDLGVDAGMHFSAKAPVFAVGVPGVAGASAGASAGADAGIKTKLVVGPFDYRLTAAKVKHSAPGLDHAFWRLDGAEYVEESDPGLRVVVRIPKETGSMRVTVTIQARRYFSVMNARFQEAVRSLPDAIANFFKGGTPLGDSGTWDLSPEM